MRLTPSILLSALLQTSFVAVAMLGSWEMVAPSPLPYMEDSQRIVQVTLLHRAEPTPAPPVIEPPLEQELTVPEPEEPVATTTSLDPPPRAKKPLEPKRDKATTPKEPDDIKELTLHKPTLKVLATSTDERAPQVLAELADKASSVIAPAANAQLVPSSSKPALPVATLDPVHRPEEGSGRAGSLSDADRAGVLKSYKRLLYKTIDKNKSLPRAARRARLQGTVYLLVTFDAAGEILAVKVRKSSGHDVLDEGAIDTIRSLGALPAPPSSLGWTKKSLTIPIRYKI